MLIHNTRLITWGEPNQILEARAVRLADGTIAEIGPEAELLGRYPQEERLDGGGQFLMPGNICAHTHFYGAFARGMAIPGRAPRDFPEILRKLWWPLDKSLTLDDVRASAEVCLVGRHSPRHHHADRPPRFAQCHRRIARRDRPGGGVQRLAGRAVLRGHRP